MILGQRLVIHRKVEVESSHLLNFPSFGVIPALCLSCISEDAYILHVWDRYIWWQYWDRTYDSWEITWPNMQKWFGIIKLTGCNWSFSQATTAFLLSTSQCFLVGSVSKLVTPCGHASTLEHAYLIVLSILLSFLSCRKKSSCVLRFVWWSTCLCSSW